MNLSVNDDKDRKNKKVEDSKVDDDVANTPSLQPPKNAESAAGGAFVVLESPSKEESSKEQSKEKVELQQLPTDEKKGENPLSPIVMKQRLVSLYKDVEPLLSEEKIVSRLDKIKTETGKCFFLCFFYHNLFYYYFVFFSRRTRKRTHTFLFLLFSSSLLHAHTPTPVSLTHTHTHTRTHSHRHVLFFD